MRIVFVSDDIEAVGGIQTATHTLAQHLARRSHQVHAVGLYRNPAPAVLPEAPVYQRTVLDAPPPGSPPDPGRLRTAKRRMRQLLDTHPGTVVIMSSVHVSLWLHDLPTIGSHLRVGHYHGSYQYAATHYHHRVIRELWPRFAACVFLSREDAAKFAADVRLRATWIPNPLPPPAPRGAAAPGGPNRLLAVGRLTPIKRFDLAITAFIRAGVEGWALHIIGDGEQHQTLRLLAGHRPDSAPVVFRGRLPAHRMPAEYAAADLLAVTSEHEGFGMVIAEAAAAGTPTIAFDVSGGVRSLVAHDRTGLLIPPGDVDGFTWALRALMSDPTRRRHLGQAARGVAAGLRPDTITDRWQQLLARMANDRRVRP